MVLVDKGVPKKRTDEMMMATRFTTLHTPCETGLTLERVLKANCRQIVSGCFETILVCNLVSVCESMVQNLAYSNDLQTII